MDATNAGNDLVGLGARQVGRGAEELGRPLQSAQGVFSVVGVLVDAGHGQGVQHLEEQSGETTDEHGRKVGVHPSDDRIGIEVGQIWIHARRRRIVAHAHGPAQLSEHLGAYCLDPFEGRRLTGAMGLGDEGQGFHDLGPYRGPPVTSGRGCSTPESPRWSDQPPGLNR